MKTPVYHIEKYKPAIERLLKSTGISNPNLVFMFSVAAFLADAVTNYFIHIPIFVAYLILLLPALWLDLWLQRHKTRLLLVFAFVFIIPFIINCFLHSFHRTNISDLIFILFLPTAYFYYKNRISDFYINKVHIFLVVTVFMFSFAFVGINSTKVNRSSQVKIHYPNTRPRTVKDPKSELNFLESYRKYNHGLFRIPHISAYFLGFLALFYGFVFSKRKNYLIALLAFGLIVLMLYSGVRTFFAAAALSLIIIFIQKKSLIYAAGFAALFMVMLYFRETIYLWTADTYLSPYTGTLVTVADNIGRFSRLLIWHSWWIEFSQFEWYQILIGKSFFSSILANSANLHLGEWFHNDLLSILYAYGFPAFVLYCYLFVRIYMDHSKQINGNFIIGLFFWCMPFLALINGLYYYFPLLFLFVFLAMIKDEKPN
ncbi:MAG: hypothetical protein K9H16_09220 [Bacteroidales bacterium]|nr:hypothetical protein [Bacteroidales bacterium]